jgi:hypothetical protein
MDGCWSAREYRVLPSKGLAMRNLHSCLRVTIFGSFSLLGCDLGDRVEGSVTCASPDPGGSVDMAVPFLPVQVGSLGSAKTTNLGTFSIPVGAETTLSDGPVVVNISYDGSVENDGGTTTLRVIDDLRGARGTQPTVNATLTTNADGDRILQLDPIRLSSADCEIWRIGASVVSDFHTVRGASMPGGQLLYMRRDGLIAPGRHALTFYDYVDLSTNFLDVFPQRFDREMTLFHEGAHAMRDLADGDETHWHGDNVNFIYARVHHGLEISEEPYAFHEGWADYWAFARHNGRAPLPVGPYTTAGAVALHQDWVENLVANRLMDLANCSTVGDSAMVQTLENNPGTLHSLFAFETALCSSFDCCGLERSAPAACPLDYHNDGLTCRLDNIRVKPSYGRGAGTIPSGCGGEEMDGALCYPWCAAGYDGVGPVCWQDCPAGYQDDGAFCRRDAHIFAKDSYGRGAGYPLWECAGREQDGLLCYDWCRAGYDGVGPVCWRYCPEGYTDDGAFCRRDAHIFAKSSYGRGVGRIPSDCGAGLENDAGLCYPLCAPGFDGVGPVCWGQCDPGYADHGATCYRDPHIIRRYP